MKKSLFISTFLILSVSTAKKSEAKEKPAPANERHLRRERKDKVETKRMLQESQPLSNLIPGIAMLIPTFENGTAVPLLTALIQNTVDVPDKAFNFTNQVGQQILDLTTPFLNDTANFAISLIPFIPANRTLLPLLSGNSTLLSSPAYFLGSSVDFLNLTNDTPIFPRILPQFQKLINGNSTIKRED